MCVHDSVVGRCGCGCVYERGRERGGMKREWGRGLVGREKWGICVNVSVTRCDRLCAKAGRFPYSHCITLGQQKRNTDTFIRS